jgi:hypothetical protein
MLPPGDEEITVQASIPRALTYLSEKDQSAFRKKFRKQGKDDRQAMHTFRELLAGVFVARLDDTPHYEPKIDGQTPDWQFKRDGQGDFLADVMSFHIDRDIELEQQRALQGEGQRSWCGSVPDHSKRLYPAIQDKVVTYKELVARRGVPFVVFVHGLFSAFLLSEDIKACLSSPDGLFPEYPMLSGAWNMYEKGNCLVDASAGYRFDFYENPNATYPAPSSRTGCSPIGFPAANESRPVPNSGPHATRHARRTPHSGPLPSPWPPPGPSATLAG